MTLLADTCHRPFFPTLDHPRRRRASLPPSAYPRNLRRPSSSKANPSLEFRKVGVDLSKPDSCMAPIVEATSDLDVTLVFNNAGFITTGFFSYTPIGRSVRASGCP